ncbi:phage tail protein [Enterobacter ludwigii]|uniref:phage tail protein n=3 Tax=Enterobacter TaxID=547 RepID=UPI003BEEB5A7
MPDDSGNTRYTVLATEVYAGQYWVTLISKNEFYVGQVVISGKTANWCRYYNTGWKPTANDVGALPLAGGTMAPAGQISVSQVGRGMWTSQNTVGAPVFQDIDTTATSEYWPIFKQHYQQGNSTWSAGMLINEGDFHLHFLNSAGDTANFRWVKDGQFIPGNYTNFDNRYLTKSENIPAGIPLPWPTATPPSGWLICNGSAFNKTTCPQLAAVYPSGNLPDLRAQFIRGLDNGKNIDAGRAILSTQASQAPRSSVGSTYKNTTWNDHATVKTGYYMTTGTDNDGTYQIMAESETQRETRPTNVAFNYIVRAA